MTVDDLPSRARYARIRAGFFKPEMAALAIGCGRTTVMRWEKDADSISASYLLAAAKAYKVRPEWLAMQDDDDGYPWAPEDTAEGSAPSRSPRKFLGRGLEPIVLSGVSANETPDGHVRVLQLEATAGMGGEIENADNPEVIRAIDFEYGYIRSIVGFVPAPGRLALITGRGDSMTPLIQPGDVVVVDTGISSFDGDGIYLINMGNGHQIKRLIDRGIIHVASENKSYGEPFPLPEGSLIGGKVYLRNRIERFN